MGVSLFYVPAFVRWLLTWDEFSRYVSRGLYSAVQAVTESKARNRKM